MTEFKQCKDNSGRGCGKDLPKDGVHFGFSMRYNKEGAGRMQFNGLCRDCWRKEDRKRQGKRQETGKGNLSKKQMNERDIATPMQALFLHELPPTDVDRKNRYVST